MNPEPISPRTFNVSHDISPRAPRDDEIAQLRQQVTALGRRLELVESVVGHLDQLWRDARRHGWLTKKADT